MKKIILPLFLALCTNLIGQAPQFGYETPVTISGYTLDAMEPFLSADGNAMFFNSLNNGSTTTLYYAARVNDSLFSLVGPVPVVNETVVPHLDAVPSLDTADNFYWVTTRNYPSNFNNLHRIRFLQTGYTNFGRVYGTMYIYSQGWLIMDAAISYQGDQMIYCNAKFNGCNFNMPCRSAIGFANKVNDSTFNKSPNSSLYTSNINDTLNYIVYAPQMTQDGLELYFTRAAINVAQTEICVSVRSNTNSAFSAPAIIYPMSGLVPEAATISTDKSRIYYHRQSGGVFRLFMRKRTSPNSLNENFSEPSVYFHPNPGAGLLTIDAGEPVTCYIYDLYSRLLVTSTSKIIDISAFPPGTYYIRITGKGGSKTQKLILAN